jgi:hypothetical protein
MALAPLLAGAHEGLQQGQSVLVETAQRYAMQEECMPHARLMSLENGALVRREVCVCTPTGAILFETLGRNPFLKFQKGIVGATDTFRITGQTVTGAGAPLGGCRVVVYETGRISVTATPPRQFYSAGNPNEAEWESPSPVVAETVSDGSGNFDITVPMNVAHQLTGYLVGSPDRAGITRDTVTPESAVLIYLRDPTVADSGGPVVSTYSRSRVVNV